MARLLRFCFGIVAYLLFFAAFVYLIAFVGNLYVPNSIDVGPQAPLATAILIDVGLIALFGLQHSVMARPGFKAWLTTLWPASIERSLYVLATVAVLVLLYEFWRPIPAMVWSVEADWLRTLLWVPFFTGWGIVFVATWLINHFELFGVAQVWDDLRGKSKSAAAFRTPFFYRYVRHPIYMGFMLAFWSAPDMSQGHLLFAAGMTIYMLIGIRYEERDLVQLFGVAYTEYRTRVGMVIPGIGKTR